MEHLVEITDFLASISTILLVSGLIIIKTNFPLSSKSAESDKKITFWFQGNELKQSTDAAQNMNWKWYRMSWKTRRFPFGRSLNLETS